MSEHRPMHFRSLLVAPAATNHEQLPVSGRAGRNLPAAVASAVILILALAVALVFSRPVFIAFVIVLIMIACWEIAGAFARKNITVQLPPLYIGSVSMIVAGAVWGPFWVMASLYLTFALTIIWRLASRSQESRPIWDIIATTFVAVYVPFAASFLALVSANSQTVWPLVFFVVIVVCNDLGGWIAGVLFGRHPMAPKLSPKKSWEGFAGSVFLCICAGVGATFVLEIAWWWGIILGAASAILGTLGDLLESLIKREVGLKDMSAIVPGHGGLMDRLDSLLFCAPSFYFFYAIAMGWWA